MTLTEPNKHETQWTLNTGNLKTARAKGQRASLVTCGKGQLCASNAHLSRSSDYLLRCRHRTSRRNNKVKTFSNCSSESHFITASDHKNQHKDNLGKMHKGRWPKKQHLWSVPIPCCRFKHEKCALPSVALWHTFFPHSSLCFYTCTQTHF